MERFNSTFRRYFELYLKIHPGVSQNLSLLRWCLTCLSGGFLRIKFRFFSELVNESSFSENENLGISFERFLPIFQNPHACTGGAKPTNDRSGQLSELYPLQQSLLPKNWTFIPEKLKGNRISFQPQKLKTGCKNFNNNIKKKKLNKGLSNDISGSENYHSEQKKITKTYKKQLYQ